jgi:hypothetical protein
MRRVRSLRGNQRDVVPDVAVESRHGSQVLSQLFTVARFEGLTQFLDSLGGDLFGLLDFHDFLLLVSGACSDEGRRTSRYGRR